MDRDDVIDLLSDRLCSQAACVGGVVFERAALMI